MAELAEGARLLSECTVKAVPRVRIPLSPPYTIKPEINLGLFIRLRLSTLQLVAGMICLRLQLRPDTEGRANRAIALLSEGGLGFGATWHAIAHESDDGFRFGTPQLAARSFIA